VSVSQVPAPRAAAVPAPSPAAPAPRAVIDYDFETVLAAPPRQRFVLWLMVGLIAALVIGLAIARVNIIVAANGKIETSESAIVIQPLETSVVRTVRVKMGEKVKKGEVLATLDPTFTEADEAELQAKLSNLQASFDRLNAEIAGKDYAPADPNPDAVTQRDIFRKREDEYQARLNESARKEQQLRADLTAHKTEANALAEQIRLSSEARNIYQTLVASNLASRLKLLDTTEHLVEAKSRLSTNLGEQQKLEAQIAQVAAERDAFVSEWRRKLAEELAKTRSDRDATAAQLSKARLRHQLSVMRAPQDATVLEVADRPPGSVVRPAEPLMRLVPSDAGLVAQIQVDTRDVARLHIGDRVTLKFEALPWQQFGLAYGKLTRLTPDTLDDANPRETAEDMSDPGMKMQARARPIHYRARVELTETRFRNLPQGFAYVLNPITRVLDESLREP
jgi:hemolysin D